MHFRSEEGSGGGDEVPAAPQLEMLSVSIVDVESQLLLALSVSTGASVVAQYGTTKYSSELVEDARLFSIPVEAPRVTGTDGDHAAE